MLCNGSIVFTRNGLEAKVIPTPDYMRIKGDEQVAITRRTNEMFVVKVNPLGFRRSSLARIVVFHVTTEVEVDGDRPTIIGRKGRMVTANACSFFDNLR